MSTAEMKQAIVEKLEQENDDAKLEEILHLLEHSQSLDKSSSGLDSFYVTVKEQYGSVVQKLAE